jgi:hypothetical protein
MEVDSLSRKYLLCLVILLFGATVLTTACGATVNSKTVQLDSGAQDQNYQGVAQPIIPKNLKLSEDEQKNGIKKSPIKSSTGQQLVPDVQVTDMPTPNKEGQVDDVAKPQV